MAYFFSSETTPNARTRGRLQSPESFPSSCGCKHAIADVQTSPPFISAEAGVKRMLTAASADAGVKHSVWNGKNSTLIPIIDFKNN